MITETAYFAHEIQALRDAFADDAFEEFASDRLRTIVRRLLTTVEQKNDEADELRALLRTQGDEMVRLRRQIEQANTHIRLLMGEGPHDA